MILMKITKNLIQIIFAVITLFSLSACTKALEPGDIMSVNKVAIDGYDAVAYITESKAIQADGSISYEYQDIQWYFSSQANKDLFKVDSEKYVPIFGGFATFELTEEEQVLSNPEIWYVHNEKVYLFSDEDSKQEWFTHINEMTARAQAQWDIIIEPTEEELQQKRNEAFMFGSGF